MSYILEIDTQVCINLSVHPKNKNGLESAIFKAESFFRLRPDAEARILDGSTDEEIWSSSGAKYFKESEIYLLQSWKTLLDSFPMKVASLTVDDIVKLRVALNNAENALKRLVDHDKNWQVVYNGELAQVREAREALSKAMQRD